MVKKLWMTCLFAIVIGQAQAAFPSVYAALPNNFAGIGALRVGFSDYEVGYLMPSNIGILKILRINNNFYSALGLSYLFLGTPAIVGSGGFNFNVWKSIGIRGELAAYQGILNNQSGGIGMIGGSFNF